MEKWKPGETLTQSSQGKSDPPQTSSEQTTAQKQQIYRAGVDSGDHGQGNYHNALFLTAGLVGVTSSFPLDTRTNY